MPSPAAAILLDVADSALATRLQHALGGCPGQLWTSLAAVPAGTRVDVVIATRAAALRELGLARPGETPDAGLLLIGAGDPAADAVLPTDWTDRELHLACDLLAAAVRWRREALHTAAAGREFERLSLTDSLTGLPNRRAWEIELPRLLAAARQAGQAVCLTLLDIDRFKPVNDLDGHAAGDELLAAVGRALTASLRSADTVARLGGDEFGLLLVGTFDGEAAGQIVERVRRRIVADLAAISRRAVTISSGSAVVPAGAEVDLAVLGEAADGALRAAKQAGRDRAQLTLV